MVDDAWLNLVRIARDSGDVSSLLPPGVKSLYDAPHLFVEAVRFALYFLSFEEYPKEERPPRKIWLDREKMEAWWRQVEGNRRSKTRGDGDFMSMPQNALLNQALTGRGARG